MVIDGFLTHASILLWRKLTWLQFYAVLTGKLKSSKMFALLRTASQSEVPANIVEAELMHLI